MLTREKLIKERAYAQKTLEEQLARNDSQGILYWQGYLKAVQDLIDLERRSNLVWDVEKYYRDDE